MQPKRPLEPQYESVRVLLEGQVEVNEQNVVVWPERVWNIYGIQASAQHRVYSKLQEIIDQKLQVSTAINQYLAFLQHFIDIIEYN